MPEIPDQRKPFSDGSDGDSEAVLLRYRSKAKMQHRAAALPSHYVIIK